MTNQKTTKNQRTPTAEIRGLILDASKQIIEEDGYEAFTIRLLSEKAGVSPASIYRHIGLFAFEGVGVVGGVGRVVAG